MGALGGVERKHAVARSAEFATYGRRRAGELMAALAIVTLSMHPQQSSDALHYELRLTLLRENRGNCYRPLSQSVSHPAAGIRVLINTSVSSDACTPRRARRSRVRGMHTPLLRDKRLIESTTGWRIGRFRTCDPRQGQK